MCGDIVFRDALQGLDRGDFSRLETLFTAESESDPDSTRIVRWHRERRFEAEPKALAEALTCACFLGRTDVAEYLLTQGVDPAAGSGTGMNALHWAVNRGQLGAVRLLLRWKVQIETRSMYGSTALGTAVWSAINEPRSANCLSSKLYSKRARVSLTQATPRATNKSTRCLWVM